MSAHRKHRQSMLMATAAGLAMLLLALTFLHVAAADGTTSTDLFFSEYIEGSGNNKALEIYNGTGAPVDLGAGNYSVELYSNGSATPTGVFSPTGTLADGDVYVITTDQADPTIQAVATISLTYPSVAHFNGDDALLLKHNGVIIDRIGRLG